MEEKYQDFFTGVKDSSPIIMGYIPIGIAYGILATKSGLGILETVSMSIFVFAGSSQLISIDMLARGSAIIPIIMMTFLVNLRHLLMSASFSLHFKGTGHKVMPFLSFLITDESFAVGNVKIKDKEYRASFFLGLGLSAYLGWVISSWIGASLGEIISDAGEYGLTFVLPAMFIALLVLQIQRRLDILVAVISGLFSLLFVYLLPGNWNVILATVIAATLGVVIERWR